MGMSDDLYSQRMRIVTAILGGTAAAILMVSATTPSALAAGRIVGGDVLPAAASGAAPSMGSEFVSGRGLADVAVEGPDNSLLYYWAIPGASWTRSVVAGYFTTYSGPSIYVRLANPDGEADIVAQGPGNSLLYYWAIPGASWTESVIAGYGSTYQ
jgi:hypothetical protein